MILIEKLTVRYNKETDVLKSLDLKLQENRIHGIVGLNGSGKTTLLNSLYGLIKPDSGIITIAGIPRNMKILSFLQTENFFYSNITGNEYLGIFKNKGFDTNRWNELFKLPLNQIIDTYSTGMKKKLAILGVLKQDKPVMVLDEPFNGLDIETARLLRTILLKLKDTKTIVLTSHIIETLTNLCDFIYYLEDGKIKHSTSKENYAVFEKELFEKIEVQHHDLVSKLISNL